MDSKTINKTALVIGLFILVLATGFVLGTGAGKDYFGWLKSFVGAGPGQKTEENLSSANVENLLFPSNTEIQQEEKVGNEPAKEELKQETKADVQEVKEEVVSKEPITLDTIKAGIDEISQKTEVLGNGIRELTVLNNIQNQVNQLIGQVNQIGQELSMVRTLSQLQAQTDIVVQ